MWYTYLNGGMEVTNAKGSDMKGVEAEDDTDGRAW